MRTKHVLIDLEDAYVKSNVWQQLGQCRPWVSGSRRAVMRQSPAVHLFVVVNNRLSLQAEAESAPLLPFQLPPD